jgi:hypothetical protein
MRCLQSRSEEQLLLPVPHLKGKRESASEQKVKPLKWFIS